MVSPRAQGRRECPFYSCERSNSINTHLQRTSMKPLSASFAVALIAVACSDSTLPTEYHWRLEAHSELGVQEGSCPGPFILASYYMKGSDPEAEEADANVDGYACYLVTHETETHIFRTWTDNNVPFSQIGGCPNNFELVVDRKSTRL